MSESDREAPSVRRRGLLALGAAAAVSLPSRVPSAPIHQPDSPGPDAFMRRAAEMREAVLAAGDQGYGAVVVKDGAIVGEAPSRVVTAGDPTAHAETEAIRDAARRLGTRDLSGCVMYSTSPPCAMCETAAYWARIARLVHGAGLSDGGAPRYGGC